jgi:hypothetical protein
LSQINNKEEWESLIAEAEKEVELSRKKKRLKPEIEDRKEYGKWDDNSPIGSKEMLPTKPQELAQPLKTKPRKVSSELKAFWVLLILIIPVLWICYLIKSIWLFLILMIIIGVQGMSIITKSIAAQKKKDIKETLDQLSDFKASQYIIGNDGESGLAIDERRRKVCLIKYNVGNMVISYKDLLASEIYEDGLSVTKTSRTSQVGSALVGGLLFGGVGAVIGGLSGKTSTSDKIKRIDLRLTVNSTQSPIHDVNFLNTEGERGGLIYNEAIQKARHWHGLVEVLIKRADEEDRKQINTFESKKVEMTSVADELTKLVKLKKEGVLTESEFAEQKANLLYKSATKDL